MKQADIQNFCKKWIEKFKDANTTEYELLSLDMADDCRALGFQMDCGQAFDEAYGSAFYDVTELQKIINTVTDSSLLGSAVFSRWRYFNHWSGIGESISADENRTWFLLTLRRLLSISRHQESIFHGEPVRLKLKSNCETYGPAPEPNDVVEQHITVNSAGRVWFYDYQFGHDPRSPEQKSQCLFTISKEAAKLLLDSVAEYFSRDYTEVFATDIGSWTLQLINKEDQVFQYQGCLCASLEVGDVDLSNLLRRTTGISSLFAFDGQGEEE